MNVDDVDYVGLYSYSANAEYVTINLKLEGEFAHNYYARSYDGKMQEGQQPYLD